jgi:C1A family cysteine protease
MRVIQAEILRNGPVCAVIATYTPNNRKNIYAYTTGVYGAGWHIIPSETQGFHAVVLVGWGVDNVRGKNVPYWVVRNSWGKSWGIDGYAKMLRGENFAYVETDVWAVHPL